MRSTSSLLTRLALVAMATLALVSCSQALSKADKAAKLGMEKLQWLVEQSGASRSGVIAVNDRQFVKYVKDGPRPYQIFAILTSSGSHCGMCQELAPEVRLVANAYEMIRHNETKALEMHEGNVPNGVGEDGLVHRVFFVEIDASRYYQWFQGLGLTTIPHMFYVRPKSSTKSSSYNKILGDRLNLNTGFKAEDIAKVTLARSKVSVTIERPPEEIDYAYLLMMLITLVSIGAFCLTIGKPFIVKYVLKPNSFFVLSLVAYGTCISGYMYNRIRTVPWMGNHQGKPQLIAPGSNSQYGAESAIIGFLNVALAVGLVAMHKVHKAKTNAWTRTVACAAIALAVNAGFAQLRSIYTVKNGGYRYGYLW
eukprot:TRINITY_DN49169_c0_g1_i1.p1 TRINITY_DN49169_c0_g1~~TRINITY_DN49169_c0_g1_i1.p1  ORF type:complete len:373 (-),score=166.50 TRINITY_DN49169_c0_g1_i1:69-1166(-)